MSKINIIEPRVKEILEQIPKTRENDELLYSIYIEKYHDIQFSKEIFINYKDYKIPSFKTIERARRKIQNKQNCYLASEDIFEKRREAEQEYREYANI
jgi:hypothetical protein